MLDKEGLQHSNVPSIVIMVALSVTMPSTIEPFAIVVTPFVDNAPNPLSFSCFRRRFCPVHLAEHNIMVCDHHEPKRQWKRKSSVCMCQCAVLTRANECEISKALLASTKRKGDLQDVHVLGQTFQDGHVYPVSICEVLMAVYALYDVHNELPLPCVSRVQLGLTLS